MKTNSRKIGEAGNTEAVIPYLQDLLPRILGSKEKEIVPHLATGFGDDVIAARVGCRNRIVKHFRERLGIPTTRQRANSRSKPFAILQQFGCVNATCFATALVRRLPGMMIGGMTEEHKQFQSYSSASSATQALAELEQLFTACAMNAVSQGDDPESDHIVNLLDNSLAFHSEVKQWLTFPASSQPTNSEHGLPISIILVAGREADAVQAHLKEKASAPVVIRLNTIREIISYLNFSCLTLYGASLWPGLDVMLAQGWKALEANPCGFHSHLNAPGMLRLIDRAGVIPSGLGEMGVAVQPPSLHIRHFARRDGFLLDGRRNRSPVIYTAKPWGDDVPRHRSRSVAYALPYDISNSLHYFRGPGWLSMLPNGIRTESRDGKRFLVARHDGLLSAVARAVRSRSFQKAITLSAERKCPLDALPMAAWCAVFSSRPNDSRFFGNRKMDRHLTAIYALMTFEIDFLMRNFDRNGRLLVKQLEIQWRNLLGNSLLGFISGFKDQRGEQCREAFRSFCELNQRPARFLLACAKRRAEEICQHHVHESDGTLARRLDILRTGDENQTLDECRWITETLKSCQLFTGFAMEENDLRNHFVSYASYFGRSQAEAQDSLETADLIRGRKFSLGQMWDPERDNDDGSDDPAATGEEDFDWEF
ncbi:hypothetical protein BH09VER1_BH09VER1_53280 [soil metagenome]